MKLKPGPAFLIALAIITISGCNKTNPLVTATPADYYPLKVGNYIIYRMDSLKYFSVGTSDSVISYLAKEVVDDTITDNTGRLSYRVIRYLTDTAGIGPWTPSIAFMVTPTFNSVEVVENNLRIIKLITPVQDYLSWLGNAHIDTNSDTTQVPFMDGWNYTYANTGLPYDVVGGTVPATVTVNEADAISGNASTFVETIFSQEIYGKGIGPVYRKFLHSEYQSPNATTPAGATIGYGLTFSMVSHN